MKPVTAARRIAPPALTMAIALVAAPQPAHADEACADNSFDADAAWQEVRSELAENYAYWDRFDAKSTFDAASPTMLASPDRLAFADELETLLLLFRDSHVHVSPTSKPSMAWAPSAADLWFEQQGDRLVVSDVKLGSIAAERGVRPGWELVAIDGNDPRETARQRFAALAVSPDPEQLTYAINALAAGRLDQPRQFEFRAGGKTFTLDLPPGYGSVQRPAQPLTVTQHRDRAGHDVAVLRINNSLGDTDLIAAFDAAIAATPPTTHVIVDMRDTPSGGTSTVARAIIGHFVSQPEPYQRHELTVERVQSGVPRIWLEYVQPRAPFHAAPIVLGGRWTGSMGEGIVIGLNAAAKAPMVGSQMGQLLGAIIQDELPTACITISFANEKLWHVDGRPREEVLPDIRLPSADVGPDGRDAALELALRTFAMDEPAAP